MKARTTRTGVRRDASVLHFFHYFVEALARFVPYYDVRGKLRPVQGFLALEQVEQEVGLAGINGHGKQSAQHPLAGNAPRLDLPALQALLQECIAQLLQERLGLERAAGILEAPELHRWRKPPDRLPRTELCDLGLAGRFGVLDVPAFSRDLDDAVFLADVGVADDLAGRRGERQEREDGAEHGAS